MKEYKTLKIEERDDGISIITFNRPERLNAISFGFTDELLHYVRTLYDNFKIRVVILTGEGRGFCSGLDLKEGRIATMRNIPEEYQKYTHLTAKDKIKRTIIAQKLLSEIMLSLRRIPQPVIAAVKGPAYGGGLALALASDIRIAGESADFCNAFINIGVSGADCGSSYWLPRIVGISRATEIMYTGRSVYAEEAERIGLATKVVPDDKILDEAIAIATQILSKAPMGIRLTKEALYSNIDAPSLEAALKLENLTQNITLNTNDAIEAAFKRLGKEKPKFDDW